MAVSPTVMLMLLAVVIATVYGAHFQGGTWNWKPTSDGKAMVTYMMTFTGFRDGSPVTGDHDVCNSTAKANEQTLRTPGKLTCVGCKPGTLANEVVYMKEEQNMNWICTDWDEEGNWDIGGRTFEVEPNDQHTKVLLYFEHNTWVTIRNVPPGYDLGWRMMTEIDLSERLDNGEINSSPKTKPRPARKYHQGCDYELKIHVDDPDNDETRCRNTNDTKGECYQGPYKGDMCNDLDRITVFENCTFLFDTKEARPGWYAVSVMIEDLDKNGDPLSKISLSFLLEVELDTTTCELPIIREPKCTSRNISLGEEFTMTVVAEAANASLPIQRIETTKPSGMEVGPLLNVSGEQLQKSVTLTWTPTATGTYELTFSAVDNKTFASDWYSITLNVVERVEQLVTLPGQSYPRENQHLTLLTGNQWFVKFNRTIMRPSQSAYITLRDAADNIVKQIDSSKGQVEFKATKIRFEEMLDTSTFEGDQTFILSVDGGVALDRIHENCADGSVASEWQFTITGTKPPVIVSPPIPTEGARTVHPTDIRTNPPPTFVHECKPVKISTPGKTDGKKCFIHPDVKELTVKDESVEVRLCCEETCSLWMNQKYDY